MTDADTNNCPLREVPHLHTSLMTPDGVEEFLVELPPALPNDPDQILEAGVICGILAVLKSRGEIKRAVTP